MSAVTMKKSLNLVITVISKKLELWNIRTRMRKSSEFSSAEIKISFETSMEYFLRIVFTGKWVRKPMWINLASTFRKVLIISSLRHGRNTLSFNIKFFLLKWSFRLGSLWNKSCRLLWKKRSLKLMISHYQSHQQLFAWTSVSTFKALKSNLGREVLSAVTEKNELEQCHNCWNRLLLKFWIIKRLMQGCRKNTLSEISSFSSRRRCKISYV